MWRVAVRVGIGKAVIISLACVAIAQAQVLSRLGAVSDDAPGVQSVFEGNWVYSLSSSKLVITLEANPALIKRGALPFPSGRNGYGTAITKSGNYLYIANDSIAPSRSYLTIVNVSNPAAPSIVADLAMPSAVPSTLQIVKNGNYLYMFPESGDMQVVDVSNPAAPSIARSVSMTASGGVIVGNRLYTAERSNGVGVWDVSQPDNPTRIGSVSLSGNITEVAVSGSTLYALSGFGGTAVHLLSLATPDAPTPQSTFSTNYTADMVVYGNYLYLSHGLGNTQIVDVSNPASPSVIGIFEIGRVRAVENATARLLTAGGSWMRLYSLTTPSNPMLTTEYTVPAPRAAIRSGNKVYTAEEIGIGVYDITAPSAPTREQTRAVRPNCGDIAQVDEDIFAVVHKGNISFVRFTGSSSTVIWTNNPTPPEAWVQDRVRTGGALLAFACQPNSSAVRLVDISDPSNPQVRSDIPFVNRFDLWMGHLYSVFGSGANNFKVYSLSDPSNPAQVSALTIPFFVSDIAVGGGYAVVAGLSGELALVNVSTPTAPQLVAQRTMAGVSMPRVAYSADGYFFVYDGWNRKLEVYRVADFPNFTPFRTQALDAQLRHLHFTNDLVIGSAETDGLIVYQNLLGTGGMSITGVFPNRAGNAGTLQITIEGVGFVSNATVRLERGSSVINPTSTAVRSANRIDATFDFTGQPVNTQWDVVVRTPDNFEVRLTNGFTIVEPVPAIGSVSPSPVLPQRSVTLTISGELFTPGAQVEIRPTTGLSFSPIRASSVQFVSQRQLQATFDLSPLQSLDLGSSGRNVQVVVINANNQSSAPATLVVRGPSLDLRIANTVYALRAGENLVIEATVNGSVADEPIQFTLQGWVGGNARTLSPTQTESLGSNRWRLTFSRAEALPDGFFQQWTPRVSQMGASASASTLSVHQYRGVRKENYETQFSNLSRTLSLRLLAFDADANTTVVLRKGDMTREATQITRNTSYYPGGTILEATFPVQLTDLGQWSIEVRYGDETNTLANAVEIIKGRPYISRADWDLSLWQHDQRIVLEGNGFHAGMQAVLIIGNANAVSETREIAASDVQVNDDGTRAVAVFENLYDYLREPTWFELQLRSPYINTVETYSGQSVVPPRVRVPIVWGPNSLRAGRWETFTIELQTGGQMDAPVLSFVLPIAESDLNSGVYDFEYRIVDSFTGQEIQSGRRRATPENVLLVAQLPPIPPNTWRNINVEVRVFNSGRAAQAPTSFAKRTRYIVLLPAVVVTTGLFLVGSLVLKPTCDNFTDYAAQLNASITWANNPNSDDPVKSALIDWLLDDRNRRELLDSLSVSRKSVFQYFGEAITSQIIDQGADAIKEAISNRVNGYLLSKFKNLSEAKRREYAELLTQAYFDVWEAQKGIRDQQEAAEILKNKPAEILGNLWKLTNEELHNSPYFPETEEVNLDAVALGNFLLQASAVTFTNVSKDCIERARALERFFDRVESITPRPVRTSWDPNEKRGSQGIAGYIAPDQSIVYEILFENLATANAGAEEVLVEDTLPEALDPSTLEFFEVQVGNKRVGLPQGTNALNTQIDLRPERPVVVRVVSSYDANTRKLSVRFSGIDPNTNDYYQEGFLPPNTNPPQGEGAVRFRIRPRSDAESGTVIANRASIIFDPHLGANPPIVTNTHTLTLDKQAPRIALETPSSTTLPTTKATLRWSATDDASGVAEVEIWAQEGSNARRIGQTNAAGERTESGTVVVRARRFGDETRIITRGRDRVGNTQPFSDTPQLTLRFGQPPQFSAGLHLIGIPVQLDNPDVQSLFGFQNNQWATYNPASGQYVQHPDSATAAQIGRGYWVLLPNAVQPNIVGNLPDPEQSYTIALQQGWNLIANPWTEPLVWNRAATQVRVNGVLYALDSSSAQQFVEPYLWGWEPNPSNPQQGRYRLVYDAQLLNGIDHQLQPWRGYWIYAHQPCELILPTPEVAATTPSRSVPREGRGGWSLRIGAHLGDQYDEVMLGVSGTEQGLQVAMPPAPPSRSAVSGVQLRLIRDGAPMEAELLPRTRLQRQWTLELSVPPSDEPRTRTVLLTTPDIAQLPRGVNPVLRDLETGERRFMRGGAGWQIAVPAEGLTRRYEITLVPTSRLLRIMNLQVSGGRSNGGQFTVQYVLSDAARVTAIVEHNGKPLRTLEQGRSRSIGAHQLVWDGRDQQGRALPPGAYTLMLMAETEDGQIARATAPIVITR
jgi:hypothetical protein